MSTPVLSSTFLLTLLLLVGLIFFIRASVKDRTQTLTLLEDQTAPTVTDLVTKYLLARAYEVASIDLERNQTTFQGVVRPSLFLAIFLTLLAAVGTLCLSLVVLMLLPQVGAIAFLLVLLAPAAGVFYWRRAKRPETVVLKVASPPPANGDSSVQPSPAQQSPAPQIITVIAHRDELIQLQKALPETRFRVSQ